jgi:hypothetical protein
MITSVKEIHTTIEPSDGGSFYNYLICKVRSGSKRGRYDVYRIGVYWPNMEKNGHEIFDRIGCELPLGDCRSLISKAETNGTVVVEHKAMPRKKI